MIHAYVISTNLVDTDFTKKDMTKHPSKYVRLEGLFSGQHTSAYGENTEIYKLFLLSYISVFRPYTLIH